MDFFAAQDEARKKTGWLMGMFLLCVAGVVVSVCLLSWGLFAITGLDEDGRRVSGEAVGFLENVPWMWLLGTAGATLFVIFAGSASKALELRGGGGVVAQDLGGRLIDPSTTDTHERRLMNVVGEMAIASGVPMPQVYVMDEEEGINAFAAGTEPGNAAIGVTRGCLLRLNRSELQGVMAHEFSHILNGDMKLNMRLIGWVFGLVVISIIGRGLLESLRFVRVGGGNRDNNGGGAIVLVMLGLGVGLLIIGGIGVFFARLLQAAVSRQREFLADASAVQFTREPAGIAGALKKIGGKGSGIDCPKAEEASHLFFADGGMFSFGLATHPPLEVRIARIEKDWDGKFLKTELPPIARKKKEKRQEDVRVSGLAGGVGLSVSERVDVEKGAMIRKDLKKEWQRAVRSRDEAQALIFGLLLAEDEGLRLGELRALEHQAGRDAARLAMGWQGELGALHSAKKIALIDLAIPTLRSLSREESERFLAITKELIGSDGRVDLFEYMLQRVIEHHLSEHFGRSGVRRVIYQQVIDLADEVVLLLSAFANLDDDAKKAFEAGIAELGFRAGLVEPGRIRLQEIDQALERLEESSPLVKRSVLQACSRVVARDSILSSREAELLRAMADGIGCAIPPFVSELRELG